MKGLRMLPKMSKKSLLGPALKTLTSLNKEVGPFFLGDNSIWGFPSFFFP